MLDEINDDNRMCDKMFSPSANIITDNAKN
jgi:hypothetical protein